MITATAGAGCLWTSRNGPDSHCPAPAPAATPAPAAADEAPKPFKPPPNYKARVVKGQTMYCRQEAAIGSRFKETVCLTEAQLKDQMLREQDNRIRMDQPSPQG